MPGIRAAGCTPEHEFARIAARQHGVVTYAQLIEAGLSASAIDRRVRKGALHRVHRGVFRVGHCASNVLSRYYAAVAACGESAALSGSAVRHVLALLRGHTIPPPEVVTTAYRRVPGVTVRRVRVIEKWEVATYEGIRCTTLARTLVDLAARLSLADLAVVHHDAVGRYRLKSSTVQDVLARHPNAPGIANVRAVVLGDAAVLLSRLERGFRRFLRDHGFPLPITNRPAGAHFVDCRWPKQRLTVELDSYRWHGSRHSWESDRERERAARTRGDEFQRFTWRDVFEDQSYMTNELFSLLPAMRAQG